jgi:hypothetical protein
MAEFKAMLSSIFFPPNFRRTFTNGLPTSLPLPGHYGRTPTNGGAVQPLPPGNAQRGRNTFMINCDRCHALNRGGRTSTAELQLQPRSQHEVAFKMAQLRSLADKVGMNGQGTNSRAGFGFMHNGAVDTLTRFLVDGFAFGTDALIADQVAFLLCFTGSDLDVEPTFSQDVAAATGKQVTWASASAPPMLNAMFSLAQRTNSRVELIVRGRKDGRDRSWLMRPQIAKYQPDRNGEVLAKNLEVIAGAGPGNEFTAMLVPEGSGVRIALDRDLDGYFDTTETDSGSNPADPNSYPFRILGVSRSGDDVTLRWESVPGATYVVQWRASLSNGEWNAIGNPAIATNTITTYTDSATQSRQFYRVQMQP